MTTGPQNTSQPGWWSGTRLLKGIFFLQCAIGAMVLFADVPTELFSSAPKDASPGLDVPIAPGNQTRRFEPERVVMDLPNRPDLPEYDAMPSRLEFATISSTTGDNVALLHGTISDGDAQRFSEWLASLPESPSAIALNSPGGEVGEALEIGQSIRALDLPTLMEPGAVCLSACPYILAGGTERVVSKTSYVGVHQHYFGENTYLPAFLLVSDIQAGHGDVMVYLEAMGIDPMLLAKALVTPPDDIYLLLPDELTRFNLATSLLD